MTRALLLAIVLHAGLAGAERFRHVPPAEVESGTSVELVIEAAATTPTLVAHVRTTGQLQFRAIELVRREDSKWIAVVPVVAPGLDYYIEAGGQPVFATLQWPHTLSVHLGVEAERRVRDTVRIGNRRSRVHSAGEWVDFGTRTANGVKVSDNYYRIDADFSYKLWAYPVEEIKVGYTRLLGTTASTMCPDPTCQAGFKVGGWFEVGLAPIEGIRFDARAIVLATAAGFAVGGRAEGRLGVLDASHVALGVEYLADVGSAAYFRLGWGTIPNTPMAATVEVTNLPASTSNTAVRFYYDIGRDVGAGVRIGVRVGYAARSASLYGITGGGGITVDF